eukprot:3401424-Pyramimonas_sp.AAC.1
MEWHFRLPKLTDPDPIFNRGPVGLLVNAVHKPNYTAQGVELCFPTSCGGPSGWRVSGHVP